MAKRNKKYYVCEKNGNGVWFESTDRQECIDYIELAPVKCQEPSNKFYVRKVRL